MEHACKMNMNAKHSHADKDQGGTYTRFLYNTNTTVRRQGCCLILCITCLLISWNLQSHACKGEHGR